MPDCHRASFHKDLHKPVKQIIFFLREVLQAYLLQKPKEAAGSAGPQVVEQFGLAAEFPSISYCSA